MLSRSHTKPRFGHKSHSTNLSSPGLMVKKAVVPRFKTGKNIVPKLSKIVKIPAGRKLAQAKPPKSKHETKEYKKENSRNQDNVKLDTGTLLRQSQMGHGGQLPPCCKQ